MTAAVLAGPAPAPPAAATGWPEGWPRVVAEATRRATPAALASPLHGPVHWRAVARVGLELCRLTPGADLGVVVLFALLHDSQRRHDGHDPAHGHRAAVLVRHLHARGALALPWPRLMRLYLACGGHAGGHVVPEPTIGCCWDADRLNLWRVGVEPDPAMLSTAAARDPAVLAWSREVHADPPSWPELELLAA